MSTDAGVLILTSHISGDRRISPHVRLLWLRAIWPIRMLRVTAKKVYRKETRIFFISYFREGIKKQYNMCVQRLINVCLLNW